MKNVLLLPIVLLAMVCGNVIARQPDAAAPTKDRVAAWTQDIDVLVEQLPQKHKNVFFKCTQPDWEKRAAEIKGRIGELSDAAMVVELRRLVAMIGDGHTMLAAGRDATTPPARAYPIAMASLSDGIIAPLVPKEHEALIGQKLVKIGGMPIDAAIAKAAEVRAYDNNSGKMQGVMQELRDPDVLVGLGIIKDADKAEFTFADAAGKETTITLAPVPPGADVMSLVVQKPDLSMLPPWRSVRRFPFGHEYLADAKTFYIWYDTCADQPTKKVGAFIEDAVKAMDEAILKGAERVAVDFRRNGGGNSALFMPMIEQLSKRELLKARGRLFGLIGRRTFSSGMMNAYQMRNATGCLLLGEPTGGSPNGYGEVKTFQLPNSKLTVQYSTKRFRGVKEDTDAIYPELTVAPWIQAYLEGRDVVIERVNTWPLEK